MSNLLVPEDEKKLLAHALALTAERDRLRADLVRLRNYVSDWVSVCHCKGAGCVDCSGLRAVLDEVKP